MVGTTRPRISTFMRRFLDLGLIEFSVERFLIIREVKLSVYLGKMDKLTLKRWSFVYEFLKGVQN